MTDPMEQGLARAVEDITPDVLPQILLRLDEREQGADATVIPIHSKSQKRRAASWLRWAVSVAAALILAFGGYFAYGNLQIDSIVNFDVNPSIQLTVNRNEKVLSVTPLNADAEGIIDNMNLKNVDLDVAVNALIGSMLKNGYLSDIANSILISVENNDGDKAATLQQRLTEEVASLLSAYALDGSVISQSFTDRNTDMESLAQRHHISYSKAELVNKLVSLDPTRNFAEIAALPVNDINLLIEAQETALEGVTSDGTASSAAYIGMDGAQETAFRHAGVTANQVTVTKGKMDYEDGRMVYEIEFENADAEYEYEIDAMTGEVLDFEIDVFGEKESIPVLPDTTPQADQFGKDETDGEKITYDHGEHSNDGQHHEGAMESYIGINAAKQLALTHAGLDSSQVRFKEEELDDDDDRMIYEIKFISGTMVYKYEIDAITGEIIKAKSELDD